MTNKVDPITDAEIEGQEYLWRLRGENYEGYHVAMSIFARIRQDAGRIKELETSVENYHDEDHRDADEN